MEKKNYHKLTRERTNMDNSLEDMMKADGWELKYYVNSGVRYWAFHKEGFLIHLDNIDNIVSMRKWYSSSDTGSTSKSSKIKEKEEKTK